ncbi:hypothetical protein L6164_033238 [Bauhinia variegata]|uniref:Uncharacterized protein n=1 Tax=Bauhinia variegata TaxID=167791 RepID=A0ACB9KR96_BAUVA|nr:hypothetical protein L6164_033238 [Bauhinia variegata]
MRTSLLALCFFLFAYQATSSVIFDTDGEPVRNAGGAYYLIPVSVELHGGLRPAILGNWPTVILDTNLTHGVPVRFTSPFKIGIISSTMLLNIQFVTHLPVELVWKVGPEAPIGWTVNLSNELPLLGPFKVVPVERGYKIVYYQDDIVADVGIVHAGGFYRLLLQNRDPFIFQIKKETGSSAKMSIV